MVACALRPVAAECCIGVQEEQPVALGLVGPVPKLSGSALEGAGQDGCASPVSDAGGFVSAAAITDKDLADQPCLKAGHEDGHA